MDQGRNRPRSVHDAIEEFSKAQRLSHGNTEAVGLRGYTLGASDCAADARRVLHELQVRARRRDVPPVHQALVHLGLGDRAGVFDALERALEERDVRLTFLAIEPRWGPLVNSPEFERVRTSVGLPRIAANNG